MVAKLDIIPIVIDSRETRRPHWLIRRDDVKVVKYKLEEGDFSLQGYEDRLLIERKTVSDLVSCCMPEKRDKKTDRVIRRDNRGRFEKMWQRVVLMDYETRLLIVEGRYADVIMHNYHSDMGPMSVIGTIQRQQQDYHFDIVWTGVGGALGWAELQVTVYEAAKQFKRRKEREGRRQ